FGMHHRQGKPHRHGRICRVASLAQDVAPDRAGERMTRHHHGRAAGRHQGAVVFPAGRDPDVGSRARGRTGGSGEPQWQHEGGERNAHEDPGVGEAPRSCPGPWSRSNLARARPLTHSSLARVADDFLDARLTERRNPRSATIDTASSLEIVDLIGAEDAGVPSAVARVREEIARAIDLVEAAFRAGGRLVYVGAGTSGRLGVLDAAECPPTFGTPPEMVLGGIAGGYPALVRSVEGAEDDVNAGIGEMDARRVGPDDVVVGIAA